MASMLKKIIIIEEWNFIFVNSVIYATCNWQIKELQKKSIQTRAQFHKEN